MKETLVQELQKLLPELAKNSTLEELELLKTKLQSDYLIRANNPASHINAMMAVYDPQAGEIFWGWHLKAQKYVFNGGHVDPDETTKETARREIEEELGLIYTLDQISIPELITVIPIDNPNHACRQHFDIWYFLPVSKQTFKPDAEKLATEYANWDWYKLDQAKKMPCGPNNLAALAVIEKKIKNKA